MMSDRESIQFPFWKELAYAVIGQAAKDYVECLMVLNGRRIGQTAMTYDVRAHPDKILEECEDFFFSGYFRVLAGDSGLDGMRLAGLIEERYQSMYFSMQKAKSGRPVSKNAVEEDPVDKKRRQERERYRKRMAARRTDKAERIRAEGKITEAGMEAGKRTEAGKAARAAGKRTEAGKAARAAGKRTEAGQAARAAG